MLISRIAVLLCLIALLLSMSAPVAAPAVFGEEVTFSVTVCFGCNVSGKAAPDTVNSFPLTDGALIVSGAVPVEVTVKGKVAVDPTVTLPKFRLAGLAANCAMVRVTPVPARRIAVDGPAEELLLMVIVPVIAPMVRAADRTWRVAVWPGLRVSGNLAPGTLNPAPLTAMELMVNGAVPVEVSVIGSVAVEPTVTLPKLRLVALTERVAVPAASAGAEIRPQAYINTLTHRLKLRR